MWYKSLLISSLLFLNGCYALTGIQLEKSYYPYATVEEKIPSINPYVSYDRNYLPYYTYNNFTGRFIVLLTPYEYYRFRYNYTYDFGYVLGYNFYAYQPK